MVVKVEASEKRVNFVGLLNLSTEMDPASNSFAKHA